MDDQHVVIGIIGACRAIRGEQFTAVEQEEWRFRIRAHAAARKHARAADRRLIHRRSTVVLRRSAALEFIDGPAPGDDEEGRPGVEVVTIGRAVLRRYEPAPRRRRGRLLLAASAAVTMLMAATFRANSDQADQRLLELMSSSSLCAEEITVPDVLAAASLPYAHDQGPAEHPDPDRLVHLHFADDPAHGWLAWARLDPLDIGPRSALARLELPARTRQVRCEPVAAMRALHDR